MKVFPLLSITLGIDEIYEANCLSTYTLDVNISPGADSPRCL